MYDGPARYDRCQRPRGGQGAARPDVAGAPVQRGATAGVCYVPMDLASVRRPLGAAALVALTATVAVAETPDEAPQYTLATWTARDGLPSSYVLSLAQDREGYLWVGTTAGLARFDGDRFTAWPRSGPMPMPSPLVRAICPARDGTLWFVAGSFGVDRKSTRLNSSHRL